MILLDPDKPEQKFATKPQSHEVFFLESWSLGGKKYRQKSIGIPLCIFMLIFAASLPGESRASETVTSVIATNISVDNKVVRLSLPTGGIGFTIAWIGKDGKQWQKTLLAREGIHAYEMRNHIGWNGEVRAVGITGFPGARGGVISPSWKDEWDIFWAPEQWIPSTINVLHGHSLLGFTWNSALLAIMFVISLIIYFTGTRLFVLSLFIGFVIAHGFMDLRAIYDHIAIIKTIDENFSMNLMKDLKKTGEMIKEKVAKRSWTQKGLPWPHYTAMAYILAEHRYIPSTSDTDADIVIKYGNDQVLYFDRTNK